ncbi:hypothetical protein [Sphingobacterium sp.]|uniref:hypothetical protein n=1 Tax=Sphingobacterium sp. TaxID=341027 RepID=UPI0031D9C85B
MLKIYLLTFVLSFWKIAYSQVEWNYSIQPKIVQNSFSWDIAGNSAGENPNVLSELSWKDIIQIGITTQIGIKFKNKFSVDFAYNFSKTVKGTVSDIDYSEDNKNAITENQKYNSDKGNSKSYNLNFGYIIHKHWGELDICANAIYEKNIYFLLASEKHLHSSYQPKFIGGGLGITAKVNLNSDFELDVSNIYSLNKYTATADWNLRTDFSHPKSFEHTATTCRIYGQYGISYKWRKQIHIAPFIAYTRYVNIGNGLDKLYYSNGDISYTRLNNVKAISKEIGIKFIYIL